MRLKRWISILLTLCVVSGLLTAPALADGEESGAGDEPIVGPGGEITPVGEYNITTEVTGNGHITISPSQTLSAGTTVTVTLIPEAGYEVSSITITPEDTVLSLQSDQEDSQIYTFVMPAADVTVTATFSSPWSKLKSALAKADNNTTVCLTGDVTRNDSNFLSSKGGTLDLNGYTLYSGESESWLIWLRYKDSLTITDSSAAGTGKIVCQTGIEFFIQTNNGTSLTLNGGSIIGKADPDAPGANYGVYVSDSFTMTGGKIEGCGNGVVINKNSSFEMNGGTIEGCSSGVSIAGGGSFTMTGGTIEGCHNGVDVKEGNFTMTGGSVTGNTEMGVDVSESGSVVLSGSPVIYGNNITGVFRGNLRLSSGFLSNGKTVTVSGALSSTANIGVTMDMIGAFAEGGENYTLTSSDVSRFTSDDAGYTVIMEDGAAKLTGLEFKGHQLVLSGQIGMNFYMSIPDDMANGTMTFTVGSRKAAVSGTRQSDGRYMFTCYINSVEMAETITAAYTYTASDGEKTVTDTASVKEYLETIIAYKEYNGEDPKYLAYKKAAPLAIAIYNYGYYAMQAVPEGQKHIQMPDTYTGETTLVTSLGDGYAISAKLDKNVITAAGYTLNLDSETAINFYLTTETELTKENVTVTADGADFDYTVKKVGSRYRVQITGIGAHELGTVFKLTTGQTEISASAMSYVRQSLGNPNAADETKQAAAALYEYYQKAIEYRDSH